MKLKNCGFASARPFFSCQILPFGVWLKQIFANLKRLKMKYFLTRILNLIIKFANWSANAICRLMVNKKFIFGYLGCGICLDFAALYIVLKKGIQIKFPSEGIVAGITDSIINGFVKGYGPEIGLLILFATIMGLFCLLFKWWDYAIALGRLPIYIGFGIHLPLAPFVVYYIFFVLLRSP